MRLHRNARLALAPALVLALAACDIGTAPGEDGNVNLRTEDRMFGEYPYAVGVRAVLQVELTSAGRRAVTDRTALTVHTSDAAVFEAEWEEPGARLIVEATGPGTAHIEFRQPDGSRLDRVALSAEAADRLVVTRPVPLSTISGPPPDEIAFDLPEVRLVEGGRAAELHVDVVDAGDDRLAGRLDVDLNVDDEDVAAAGRSANAEGEIGEGPVRTNGALAVVPLEVGETTLSLSQDRLDADGTITVRVVPADAAVSLVHHVDASKEAAADPSHLAHAVVRVDLEDDAGHPVLGGRCTFVNETPDVAALFPEEGESPCWFFVAPADGVELGVARITVTEQVTGLETEIEVPVGAGASGEEDSEDDPV